MATVFITEAEKQTRAEVNAQQCLFNYDFELQTQIKPGCYIWTLDSYMF